MVLAPLPLALSIAGFICFVIASTNVGAPIWNRLVSIGLALWILILVLGYAGISGVAIR